MSYFYLEFLKNRSEFHKATPLRGGRGFRIKPARDTPECHIEFDNIVEIASADIEGYSIKPHPQKMRGGYKYDMAVIIPDE